MGVDAKKNPLGLNHADRKTQLENKMRVKEPAERNCMEMAMEAELAATGATPGAQLA